MTVKLVSALALVACGCVGGSTPGSSSSVQTGGLSIEVPTLNLEVDGAGFEITGAGMVAPVAG